MKNTKNLTPRYCAVACPINPSQILIMGGWNVSLTNEVFVFNTANDQVKKVAKGGGELVFKSVNNTSVAVSENRVVAFVTGP